MSAAAKKPAPRAKKNTERPWLFSENYVDGTIHVPIRGHWYTAHLRTHTKRLPEVSARLDAVMPEMLRMMKQGRKTRMQVGLFLTSVVCRAAYLTAPLTSADLADIWIASEGDRRRMEAYVATHPFPKRSKKDRERERTRTPAQTLWIMLGMVREEIADQIRAPKTIREVDMLTAQAGYILGLFEEAISAAEQKARAA